MILIGFIHNISHAHKFVQKLSTMHYRSSKPLAYFNNLNINKALDLPSKIHYKNEKTRDKSGLNMEKLSEETKICHQELQRLLLAVINENTTQQSNPLL